jgi:hypothetical protein
MEAALTAVLLGLLIHRHERTLVPVPPPSEVFGENQAAEDARL